MTDYTITADELAALREWVRCPEHGPFCRTSDCCCADKHGLGGNPVIDAILARYPEQPDVDEREVEALVDLGRDVKNCERHADLWCSCKVREFARAAIRALDEHRRHT